MTEFESLLEHGFGEVLSVVGGGVTITANGKTRPCLLSPLLASRELRDSGLLEQCDATVEMKKSDFAYLGIEDRTSVITSPPERKFKVMVIDTDPHDPTVRLHLKPERTA